MSARRGKTGYTDFMGEVMYASFEEVRREVASCEKCGLCATRTNTVFGCGDPRATLMFVGEGPGADEDAQGLPFVGRAGKLLDKMIAYMGLSREEVYIANIVKCRPPGNRDPRPEEEEACIGYLRAQVAFIRPKIIVALGRIAATRLIDPDFKITRDHGKWYEKKGFLMTAIYHPAALLRDPAKKTDTARDLDAIAARLSEIAALTGERV